MSLLPQYTAPPAITWISSYWADDPLTGGGVTNSQSLDVIQSSEHIGSKGLKKSAWGAASTFTRYDPSLNNRGSWTVPFNGLMASSIQAAQATPFSVVWIGYFPAFTSGWASYGGPRTLTQGAGLNPVSGSNASLLDGNYASWTNVGGGNANFFSRRAVVGQPHLLVQRVANSGGCRIMVNGENYGPGAYSDAAATLSVFGFGYGVNEVPYGVGFVGYYAGDVTTDPNWSSFLTWVQNHYGFDPTATYDTADPPPIAWRAEYLADDFDANTGTWPDRTGRGYTLNPGGLALTSRGLRSFGANTSISNCAKVDNFAGLQFTGDFEVQAKIREALPANAYRIIGGCFTGSAASA